jgi:hypothetical protein
MHVRTVIEGQIHARLAADDGQRYLRDPGLDAGQYLVDEIQDRIVGNQSMDPEKTNRAGSRCPAASTSVDARRSRTA